MSSNTRSSVSLVVVWENTDIFDDNEAITLTLQLCEQLSDLSHKADCELVVVHDPETGSSGSALELCRMVRARHDNAFDVRDVKCPGSGYVDQKAAGIESCKSEVVVFADCDCRQPEGWLARMAEPLLSGEADIVHGNIVIEPNDFWRTAALMYWIYSPPTVPAEYPTWIFFCALGVLRTTYDGIPFPKGMGDRTGCIVWPERVFSEPGLKIKPMATWASHPAPAEGFLELLRHAWLDGRYKRRALESKHTSKSSLKSEIRFYRRSMMERFFHRRRQIRPIAKVGGLGFQLASAMAYLRIATESVALMVPVRDRR